MSDNRTPAQIQKDLDRTRAELTDTVNELVERLDPRAGVKNAAHSVKEKTSHFADTVKEKAHSAADSLRDTAKKAKSAVASSDEHTDNSEYSPKPATRVYSPHPQPADPIQMAENVVEDARAGEPTALAVLGSLGVAATGAVALLALAFTRK